MSLRPVEPDASVAFANHFASTRYDQLTPDAVAIAKHSIIDTVGVSLAATALAPECRGLGDLAAESATADGSRLWGRHERVPAPVAAWFNGALAHALDFDDIAYDAFAHPSAAVVPAVLAVAERVGGVSGKDLIAAVALGQDMVIRLQLALDWKAVATLRWLPFAVVAPFAVAAAAGKLLGLNAEQLRHAIAIALAHASGAGESKDGPMRGLYNATSAHGGVVAALMAEKGVRGPARPLEGQRGFFASYWNDAYDRDRLLVRLGSEFMGETNGYKAWPSCAVTHPPIDAALKLVTRHAIDPDDIESITVHVSPAAWPQCDPIHEKRRPSSGMDAKFSVPFTVALACDARRVVLGDFNAERIRDARVARLAELVTPRVDAGLAGPRGVDSSIVEITTRDGRSMSERSDCVFGHHANPMSLDAVTDKFIDCTAYAAQPVSTEVRRAFVDSVANLERMGSVDRLLEPFCSAT